METKKYLARVKGMYVFKVFATKKESKFFSFDVVEKNIVDRCKVNNNQQLWWDHAKNFGDIEEVLRWFEDNRKSLKMSSQDLCQFRTTLESKCI